MLPPLMFTDVGMMMMQTGMVKGENMNQSYVEGRKVLSNITCSLASLALRLLIDLLADLFSFIDRLKRPELLFAYAFLLRCSVQSESGQ